VKLILTREVAGLGLAGDIVDVADGYGRNFLVPRGAAITWTKGAEKQISQIKRSRDAREIRDLGHAREIKTDLERLLVKLDGRQGGRRPAARPQADSAAGPHQDDRHAHGDRRPAPRRRRLGSGRSYGCLTRSQSKRPGGMDMSCRAVVCPVDRRLSHEPLPLLVTGGAIRCAGGGNCQ